MTRQEMTEQAAVIRSRDRFGPMTAEEIAALPGTEKELAIPIANGKTVRVYEIRPDAPLPPDAPMLINYHGGGFLKGRADRDCRYCCALMEKLNCLVWDVDYSLAPEYPYPTAIEESYGVAVYAFEHADELGVNPSKIALAGHSAGANIVAAVCINNSALQNINPCAALMEYFPADNSVDPMDRLTDAQKQDERAVARAVTERTYNEFYCTAQDAENPLCSPLKASAEQLSKFPPSLVISAGKDSLCDETESFAVALIKAGVTVTAKRIPEAMHGFTTNRTEGWERALNVHKAFFAQYL